MANKKNEHDAGVIIAVVAITVLAIVVLISFTGSARWQSNVARLGGTGANGTAATTAVQYVIPVQASGIAYAAPTQAEVDLFVNGTGDTAAQATQNISSSLSALNATIYKYTGGNMSLAQTTWYSMTPENVLNYTAYEACLMRPGFNESICRSLGLFYRTIFLAQEGITVTLPKVSDMGPFLGAVSGVEDLRVTSVTAMLTTGQITALRAKALADAMQNATSQVKAVIGQNTPLTIGNISINYAIYQPFYYNSAHATIAEATTTVPMYYAGQNKVYDSISVKFMYAGKSA